MGARVLEGDSEERTMKGRIKEVRSDGLSRRET